MYQIVGICLICVASTCSSIGMNFQKLAHRQTDFYDPRTMNKQRTHPLESSVFCRPYMIIGFVLTAAAMVCDSLALFFIGTVMIGVLGCMAIPINVFVSRYILYEEIKNTEKFYITLITAGCISCLATAKTHEPMETFSRFASSSTAMFIYFMWSLGIFLYAISVFTERSEMELILLSVLSGIAGSQFVTMGKYLLDMTWLLRSGIELPNTLQIIGVCMLAVLSLPLQIIFLNKSLEKFNATHSIAIFQCTWCILNVSQGIIIFGDMETASLFEICIFSIGFLTTVAGIFGLSKQIESEPLSYSSHSSSSNAP